MMHRPPSRAPVAAALIALTAAGMPIARGAPADPFTTSLPSRDLRPPEATRGGGTGAVDESSGTASYDFPIEVPPGRLGMQPRLALHYASSGALRGGLAVGWTLDVPVIERDPDFPGETRYRSTLPGAAGRLVPNSQDVGAGLLYRAEIDDAFTRYELDSANGTWLVRSAGGQRYEFALASMGRWYLTRQLDAFGNTVTYSYLDVPSTDPTTAGHGEKLLSAIEYSANPTYNLAAHARVELTHIQAPTCGNLAVGAAVDHSFGFWRISGARMLTQIRTLVRPSATSAWRSARLYTLSYDNAEMACSASGLRYLDRIDITGYDSAGVAIAAPTTRFGYGVRQRTLARTVQWPLAPREQGSTRGATQGFLDVDGDGRTDAVTVLTRSDGCVLQWSAGGPDGAFAITPQEVRLPSAAWKNVGGPDGIHERCTLAGQVVTRPVEGVAHDCWGRGVLVNYEFLDYNGDGALDLVSWLTGDHGLANGDFSFNNGVTYADSGTSVPPHCSGGTHEVEPGEDGALVCMCNDPGSAWDPILGRCRLQCGEGSTYDVISDQCTTAPPDGGGGGGGADPDGPACAEVHHYPQRSGESYVWYVQANLGGGQFAPLGLASRVYSPRALAPTGAAAIGLDAPVRPGLPVLIDLDGDGHLDVISTRQYDGQVFEPLVGDLSQSPGLWVYRGNGTSSFAATPVLWAFEAGWLQGFQSMIGTPQGGFHLYDAVSSLALRDINGDGAPDLIAQLGNGRLAVAYNQPGDWLYLPGQTVGGTFSPMIELTTAALPVELTRNEITDWRSDLYLRGQRGTTRRLVDLDGDGALEWVQQQVGTSVANPPLALERQRLVGGATALVTAPLPFDWEPAEARVRALSYTWRRESDLVDLTGDGLVDAVSYDAAGTMSIRTDAPDTASLRRLVSVDNGRGGITRFEYGWSTDPAIVTAPVEINPLRAVVTRVVQVAGFGQPDQRTSYRYAGPVYGRRGLTDPRPPSFLGYAAVTSERSGQAGDASARSDKTFTYAFDAGGRLATELTSVKTGTTYAPVSYQTREYAGSFLVGSLAAAYYTWRTIDRTCAAGASVDACKAQAPTLTTTEVWTPWQPAGLNPHLLLHTRTDTREGSTLRYRRHDHDVRWTASDARVLPTVDERGYLTEIPLADGGVRYVTNPGERVQQVYSAAGLPEEERRYKDASTWVTTRRTFHPSGVLQTVRRANEVAAGVWNAETTYFDAYVLHPIAQANQLSQLAFVTHDLATGQLVYRRGPAYRMVGSTVYEDTESWTLDGFGRVTSHTDSLEPAAGVGGYDLRVVETVQYVDGELPNRRLTARLRDVATGAWVLDEQKHDGAGRVIETVARRQVPGQPDRRTLYTYDAGGQLARVDASSPATGAPAGTLVATTYTRDGLGRVTSMTRPDLSREDVVYRGLESDVTEVDGTPGARTTLRKNAYGELVEVRELDNPVPGATAITRYTIDALGRVVTTIDADGVTTSLGHDWRGLRTSVTRGARTWLYAYDANGNLTSTIEPVPSGGVFTNYTSTTTYDRLNRPVTITPGTRGLTAARRAQLGIGPITYAYDGNGFAGKAHQITLPFGSIALTYEANGQVARETRSFTLNQGVSLAPTQWVERRYDALGGPVSVRFDDGTEWRYAYDHRAAVSDVKWRVPSNGAEHLLAHYDRQVTGEPITRVSGIAAQRRDWQYDVLGRVLHDRVYSTANGTTWHERDHGYHRGDLLGVGGVTNGMNADADYSVDARHRLYASTGPATYSGTFAYSAAGNLTRATVSGAVETPARDVNYQYGAVDPHAVDRIVDRTTGATIATWSYDRAGNLAARTAPGESRGYTFGADGLLHEAVGPGGTERYYFGPGAQRVVALGPGGVKIWFGESETHFSNTGVQQRRYFHIAAGEPVARAERTTPTSTHALELQYADALQNLAVALNLGNVVTAAFLYGPFGEVVASTGAANHSRRFNGKEHDQVAALRHYGWRSYDPLALRWASGDPKYRFAPDAALADPQRSNLYAFSSNNPLRYRDPDGLDLTVTGRDANDIVARLERASGMKLRRSAYTGKVEVVEGPKGADNPVGWFVNYVVLHPDVHVDLYTVASTTAIRVGTVVLDPRNSSRYVDPGRRLIDVGDLKRLDGADPRIADAALMHEVVEAATESRDPTSSRYTYPAQHAAAIKFENLMLRGTPYVPRTEGSYFDGERRVIQAFRFGSLEIGVVDLGAGRFSELKLPTDPDYTFGR